MLWTNADSIQNLLYEISAFIHITKLHHKHMTAILDAVELRKVMVRLQTALKLLNELR